MECCGCGKRERERESSCKFEEDKEAVNAILMCDLKLHELSAGTALDKLAIAVHDKVTVEYQNQDSGLKFDFGAKTPNFILRKITPISRFVKSKEKRRVGGF